MIDTTTGSRSDLVDDANFSMFSLGTTVLTSDARALLDVVAEAISPEGGKITVRGHTDALPYASGKSMNNWRLSSARAESTRQALADSGIGNARFARIEGVADREPFVKDNSYDPRNRRMSIILGWSRGGGGSDADEPMDAETRAAIKERDDPRRVAQEQARKLDMGGTGRPAGVELVNPAAGGTSSKPGKH